MAQRQALCHVDLLHCIPVHLQPCEVICSLSLVLQFSSLRHLVNTTFLPCFTFVVLFLT